MAAWSSNGQLGVSWFERVPKVELHLHLEGAIPLDTLWQLIGKYGGDPSVPSRQALAQRFQYRDFPHFLDTWLWKNGYLRETEDFCLIAEAVARDLAAQNVRYVEAHYSPSDFARHGLEPQELTRAIRDGLFRVPEIEVALIADLVRGRDPAEMDVTLQEVYEVRELGVIGVGLGGAEQSHPPEPFAAVFERARQLGFHATAHAGEAAGPSSIWGALRALEVERIGHGTRAREDAALLEHLAQQQVPLEMCPLSNVRTAVVPSLDAHPIRDYVRQGLLVSVSTDDPKMFNNSLALEYELLERELGFTRDEIRSLILNGARSSWLPADHKERLMADLQADEDWAS
jgi:adenosine deaminase